MSENDEREDAMKQRTGRESGILHIPEENTKKKKSYKQYSKIYLKKPSDLIENEYMETECWHF